jgi:8-oxo-dGTP pyrophosphatase MutT (NUDIX family)
LSADPTGLPTTPRDAATVVVLRGEPEGPSVFLVRRHAKSGFMAGAYVFPGGTLEGEDLALLDGPRVVGLTVDDAAARLGEPEDPRRALALHVAAIRETFEEAGVLLADAAGTLDAIEAARRRRLAGAPFADVLPVGARLRADALVPWARWVTPTVERRRYDARFFLTRAPDGQRAAHDRVETSAGAWMRPAEAIARFDAGELQLPPPTLRTLEELVEVQSVEAAFDRARARVPRPVQPHFLDDGGTPTLALPGDPAHPVAEPRIFGPSRFVRVDGRFVSQGR